MTELYTTRGSISRFRTWLARRSGEPLGAWGEWVSLGFFRKMGWELVARNWRSRSGEIDLVFYDRDTLVFVEVKTRRGIGLHPPEFNFSGEKFKRIEALAWNFLERYELGEIPVRYDLAAVETDDQRHYRIRHYRGVCGDDW